MEKRYQVFVSSTFNDLQEERQEIIQALLELKCIPAGMELFPAANDDQWTLIKKVIKDCDYYVVIIAGRYGSLGPDGLSFTEMEYRYALDLGIPTIGFIHKNPSLIPQGRSESDPEKQAKLREFCGFVQQKSCRYWESPSDLGSKVSRSLINLINDVPAVGWVRADQVNEAHPAEMLRLKKQIEELQSQIQAVRETAPSGAELLAQGEELLEIEFTVNAKEQKVVGAFDLLTDPPQRKALRDTFKASWNDIFSAIAPLMIDEASDSILKRGLNDFVIDRNIARVRKYPQLKGFDISQIEIKDDNYQTIKVQLRALGLIGKNQRARSVKDTGTYWALTPYGDAVMTRLRAIPRSSTKS